MRKVCCVTWFTFVVLLGFFIMSNALGVRAQKAVVDSTRALNCEYSAAMVDSVFSGNDSGNDVIIVAYKGKTESKKNIAMYRALYLKKYVSNYLKGSLHRPANRIITALGLYEPKEGELRIYIDGKPELIFHFMDNKNLRLSPCAEGR